MFNVLTRIADIAKALQRIADAQEQQARIAENIESYWARHLNLSMAAYELNARAMLAQINRKDNGGV